MPSWRASVPTSESTSFLPRPLARAGWVTTATGRKGERASRARTGVAKGGDPMKTRRTAEESARGRAAELIAVQLGRRPLLQRRVDDLLERVVGLAAHHLLHDLALLDHE